MINVDIDGMQFTAMPTDPEDHGRQIYANAVAGLYGAVAPFVPPPQAWVTWMVPRSLVIERLNAASKFNDLKTYLHSHDYERELWYASETFRNDGVLIHAILSEIGADIAAVLAKP
jgi:hypothetical protein